MEDVGWKKEVKGERLKVKGKRDKVKYKMLGEIHTGKTLNTPRCIYVYCGVEDCVVIWLLQQLNCILILNHSWICLGNIKTRATTN